MTARFHAARPAPMRLGGRRQSTVAYGQRSPNGLFANDKWLAVILAVDSARRIAKVRTVGAEAIDCLATWTTGYSHPDGAFEGVDVIPREGSHVILERIQGLYIITGWYMPSSGAERGGPQGGVVPNHAGLRPATPQPGDYSFGAISGNRVTVTADGAVILHSKSLSQLILEPLRGLGRFILRNYEKYTDGGFVKWWSDHEPNPQTNYETLIKDDPRKNKDNQVFILVGKKSKIFRLQVYKRNGEQLEQKYEIHIDPDGNMSMTAKGDATLDVEGDVQWNVGGDFALDVDGKVDFTAGGDMKLLAPNIDLN